MHVQNYNMNIFGALIMLMFRLKTMAWLHQAVIKYVAICNVCFLVDHPRDHGRNSTLDYKGYGDEDPWLPQRQSASVSCWQLTSPGGRPAGVAAKIICPTRHDWHGIRQSHTVKQTTTLYRHWFIVQSWMLDKSVHFFNQRTIGIWKICCPINQKTLCIRYLKNIQNKLVDKNRTHV